MAFTLPPGFETYFDEWEKKIGSFADGSFAESGVSRAQSSDFSAKEAGASGLAGLPFAVKDNIALEGYSFACGSRLLEGLKAPFTATALKRLLDSGCVPFGKTRLDEFGMAPAAAEEGKQPVRNPWDIGRFAGGPSEGSAAAVAAGLVPFALGSDTEGSLRRSAAFCGVLGLKPTFGAVSRFGLAAYGSSLEAIGVIADSAARCRKVFAAIAGEDPNDQTSGNAPEKAPALYGSSAEKKSAPRVIGVLSVDALIKTMAESANESPGEKNALAAAAKAAELEDEVRKGFEAAKENLSKLGFILKEVEIPCLKYAVPALNAIAAAEASAALARFDGIRFGKRPARAENPDELVDKSRAEGFGAEVKLQILLGTHVLRSGLQDRYFFPARKVRAGIRQNLAALLGGADYAAGAGTYDALLLPVFPARAGLIDAATPFTATATPFTAAAFAAATFVAKAAGVYTCAANLAGLPALSFPASVEGGLPVGVQLLGRPFAEGTLLDIAETYENAHPFARPAGYKKFWN